MWNLIKYSKYSRTSMARTSMARLTRLFRTSSLVGWLVGWLVVLGLTALWDSISVYIGPYPIEREKEKRNDWGEKNCLNSPHPHLLQAQQALALLSSNCRTPRHWKFTQDHRTTRSPLELGSVGKNPIAADIYYIWDNLVWFSFSYW